MLDKERPYCLSQLQLETFAMIKTNIASKTVSLRRALPGYNRPKRSDSLKPPQKKLKQHFPKAPKPSLLELAVGGDLCETALFSLSCDYILI